MGIDVPKNLFERYGLAVPPPPTDPRLFGGILVENDAIYRREASSLADSQLLWIFIQTFMPEFLKRIEECRAANLRLVRREATIDIKNPDLEASILKIYAENVSPDRMTSSTPPALKELSALALKMSLDLAQGKMTKFQFSENPTDFLYVPLGLSIEEIIGRFMKILQEAVDAGEPVEDQIALFESLYPHLWRAFPTLALENARQNVRMLRAGLKLVAPGTDVPVSIEGERNAVSIFIQQARRRIGDQVADLEADLAELFEEVS